MTPLTTNLEQCCQHKAGIQEVTNKSGWVSTKPSAELNKDGEALIASFGNREFRAIVPFIDMRGSGHHIMAIGELESESSTFVPQMRMWSSTEIPNDPLRRITSVFGKEDLKGVGPVVFLHSAITPMPKSR